MTLASRFKEFFSGLSSPLRVLALLPENPGLFALFILPMLITAIVIAVGLYGVMIGVWSAAKTLFFSWFGHSFALGSGILATLAALLLGWVAILALNQLIQLLSSPFNDLLAERTERALGEPVPPFSFGHLLAVFWIDLRKTALGLALSGLFLVVGILPFLGIVSVLGLAFVQALTFISYPQSRRRHGIRDSVRWLLAHPERALGFGLASLIMFSVPVLNLFALPISVMAGTKTYLEK